MEQETWCSGYKDKDNGMYKVCHYQSYLKSDSKSISLVWI